MTDHYPYECSAVDASIIRKITQDEKPAVIQNLPIPDSLKSVLGTCWQDKPRHRRTIHHSLATLYSTATVAEYFKSGAPGFLSPDSVADGLQKQEDEYSLLFNPYSPRTVDMELLLTLPDNGFALPPFARALNTDIPLIRTAFCAQISPDQGYVAVGGCGLVMIYMLFSGDVAR